jgi:cation:H+ antiporter
MGMAKQMKEAAASDSGVSTVHAAIIFTLAAAATLAAGVVLEVTGDAMAQRIGLSGVLFGATGLGGSNRLTRDLHRAWIGTSGRLSAGRQ